jgi:hypothetical protein
LHDAVAGEQLGIPSAAVMTSHFIDAAELMARVLGADGYRFVVVDHPIASATEQALAEQAALAAADCLRLLTGS